MRGDGRRSCSGEELTITWTAADADKIREAAKAIGVTPQGLIQYAVEEVLEEATFTRAIARTPFVEDARKLDAQDIIGSCDREEGA